MDDDAKLTLAIGCAILMFMLGMAAIGYASRDTVKISGREIILYVENGQPVAKWKEETK